MQKWMIKLLPVVLAVVMVFGGAITAHASTDPIIAAGYDLETLPSHVEFKTYTVIIQYSNELYVITSDGEFYVKGDALRCKTGYFLYTNVLSSGSWASFPYTGYAGDVLYNNVLSNMVELSYVSHDVYTSEGELFFAFRRNHL